MFIEEICATNHPFFDVLTMDRNTRLQDVGGSAEQLAHPSRRPSSDRIFATIRLVNDAGVESMNHLGRNYYNLSYRNRKRLNIGRTGMSFSMHVILLRFSSNYLVFYQCH